MNWNFFLLYFKRIKDLYSCQSGGGGGDKTLPSIPVKIGGEYRRIKNSLYDTIRILLNRSTEILPKTAG